MKEEKW